jgi:hypothetical protein
VRFLNEVKSSPRVTHPHVCRVYDIAQAGERHFISDTVHGTGAGPRGDDTARPRIDVLSSRPLHKIRSPPDIAEAPSFLKLLPRTVSGGC